MQADEAWETINDLGRLGYLHFIDLNHDKAPHEQQFAKIIKIIEDSLRRIE
jgi:hypothetical protein